ncbi:hypothetical protein ABZ468_08200 [Streptomyces sp. NPDC005708]|uniref:hypothetical protein n=1 Tax=Streptomyces sp. NPDC005708 TaxID=3154564 RepID=UPI0033DB55A5
MTTKIQLPPNLARHYYEARRRYLQTAGVTITPWFQLTALERTAADQEIDLVRQAIQAAETEQAIRDQFQPGIPVDGGAASKPLEDPAPPAAANESGDEEDCGHDVCRALRSLLKAFEQPEPDLVDAYTNPDLIGPATGRSRKTDRSVLAEATVTVIPLDLRSHGVPFTEEELTQLQEVAKRSLQDGMPTLVTVGADPAFLDLTFAQAMSEARTRGAVERFIEGDLADQLARRLGSIIGA